jgi:Uncharacterized conserved protein
MKDKKNKTAFSARELSMIAMFIALTAVLAQVIIPLPFSPVPISFGLVAVYSSGILLKPRHAIFAQLGYLLLGAIGVPVFGNFRGGIGVLFGATGGYLIVYPLIAWIVAKALSNSKKQQVEYEHQSKTHLSLKAGISMCIAHVILYLSGTIWLSIVTGNTFYASLSLAVFPYIPLDIVKIIFCILIIVPLRLRLLSMRLLILDDR